MKLFVFNMTKMESNMQERVSVGTFLLGFYCVLAAYKNQRWIYEVD